MKRHARKAIRQNVCHGFFRIEVTIKAAYSVYLRAMPINIISIRLLSQQLACPLFSTPDEVVSHFGIMQAQDYRMMRWAVSMRTAKPSSAAFKSAFDEGRIIRMHLNRGTWQLVSRDDYWWMLRLCGPGSIAAITGWMHTNKVHISEDELMRVREIMMAEACLKGRATKEDFACALREKGIVMDDHRLSYHIRLAELSGVLCSGELRNDRSSYSLVENKIGPEVGRMDRDESLALLARKYFRSHSPATLEDFVWWSGLGVGDCRKAIASIRGELREESVSGRTFLIHESCRTRGFRRGQFVLLPPYDEYLIGYKSRDVVLDRRFVHKAHSNNGIFHPVILSDGHVCGNWRRSSLEMEFFDGCVHDQALLESAVSRYKSFMKLR